MAQAISGSHCWGNFCRLLSFSGFGWGGRRGSLAAWRRAILTAAPLLLVLPAVLLLAQGSPHVTSVAPASGKANDTITIAGESLGHSSVSAVYLSDDKLDYKASIMDQNATKIVVKVPQVKPGDYHVSIQMGNSIYIQPVIFTVQQ